MLLQRSLRMSTSHFMDGLEEHLRATEAFTSHRDDIAIWKLVGLLFVRAFSGRLHFRVKVKGNVAELLFDIAHDLALSSCCERVTTLGENLHEVLCEITTGKIETQDGMWQGIALIDWHSVGDTIT